MYVSLKAENKLGSLDLRKYKKDCKIVWYVVDIWWYLSTEFWKTMWMVWNGLLATDVHHVLPIDQLAVKAIWMMQYYCSQVSHIVLFFFAPQQMAQHVCWNFEDISQKDLEGSAFFPNDWPNWAKHVVLSVKKKPMRKASNLAIFFVTFLGW